MRMSERKACEGVIPLRPTLGFFSPRTEIQAHLLDPSGVLVEKVGDTAQDGI
jgi:hypothetical protein